MGVIWGGFGVWGFGVLGFGMWGLTVRSVQRTWAGAFGFSSRFGGGLRQLLMGGCTQQIGLVASTACPQALTGSQDVLRIQHNPARLRELRALHDA